MDKVKKILERYAEWIALAAGAGFLLWMVYSYVYQQPVTVAVGPNTVAPGEIDDKIWNGPGKQLQGQLGSTQVVRVPVPTFGDAVVTVMGTPPADASPITGPFTDSAISHAPVGSNTPQVAEIKDTSGRILVTQLPLVPAMERFDVSQGHSNIMPVAPGGNGAAPAPPPPPPGPGGVAVAQAVDKSWVTIGSMLPAAGLNDAFTAAKIPLQGNLHQTTVLRVLLYRQEMTAAGTWGPEVLIEPPGIDAVPAPLPPPRAINAAAVQAERNYLALAAKSAALILRPDFYPVVEGDKWYAPGTPDPNPKTSATIEDVFDPATFKGDPTTLTPAQRDALRKFQQAAAAARAAAAAARRPTPVRPGAGTRTPGSRSPGSNGGRPGGGSNGGNGGDNFVIADPDRTTPDNPNGGPENGGPGAAGSAANAPAEVPLPAGPFDPAHQPDFKVWAHDDTVQPGKTYRYQLRYVISSPVYLTQQLCNPQALAGQFALTSVKTNLWSDAVNVESDSNFYAAGLGTGGTVKFDVFKWQNGTWAKQSTQVAPGDTVGANAATGSGPNPFATGWTVVDVRDVPNESADRIVLLASDNGTLERQVKLDAKNANYHRLLESVADSVKKANGGGGPPAEMVPGGGPGTAPPGFPPGQDPSRD